MRPHRWQPTRLPCPWDSPGKNTGVGCHFLLQCMKVKNENEVAQSCPTLSDPMDCSLPGSSVHGIFQARVLEWGAIAVSNDQPRQHIQKQRHYFANKSLSNQGYGFSSSHVWIGEGNGDPLQCSCLENPMDGGPWQATVRGWLRVGQD